MVNNVVLIGRLTRDPEIRRTQSGKDMLPFTIAVPRKYNRDEADFIQVVAWEQSARFINQYLGKGSLVSVTGRIQTRNYDNQHGQRVYVTEIVADDVQSLEPKGTSQNTQYNQQSTSNVNYNQAPNVNYNLNNNANQQQEETSELILDITEDDLPF